jgi:hypothetical protein
MGLFPDKELTHSVLKISTLAVAGDVLNNSLVLSLALRLIFSLPGYLFSYDIVNFFSTDHGVAGADVGLRGPGIARDGSPRGRLFVSHQQCYRVFVLPLPQLFCPGTEESTSTSGGSAYGMM